jgi:hypothetical protein
MDLLEWQSMPKDSNTFIVQASSTNCDDAWMPFPIGMCYHYTKGRVIPTGEHDNLVLCAISPTTDQVRRPYGKNRPSILNTLTANGIGNQYVHPSEYYERLPTYKFVVSPEGNGIDCHRHYEALISGCIPIVERHCLTEEKYRGLPILWTDDYSEITPAYLNAKYEEMKTATYDFSRLRLDSYTPEMQEEIKRCGNFWMKRITGRDFY